MKKGLSTSCCILWGLLLAAQNTSTLRSAVYFDTDQYVLTTEAVLALENLCAQLSRYPDYTVDLEAYTDDRGSADYNERLAANRAEAVQAFLKGKGLLADKTTVQSWGERKQNFDNNTEAGRQQNRRVDILITNWYFNTLSDFQARLSNRVSQTQVIQPDREQQVTAAGGTVLIVPPNSFVFEDGTAPAGPVQVTLREALQPSDWILNGLTTTSGDQILQSGGMFYVEARANGKPLELASGARLTVALPTAGRRMDPEMQLFYGEHTPNGQTINWTNTQTAFRQTYFNPEITLAIDSLLAKRILALRVPVPPKPQMPNFHGLPPAPLKPEKPTVPRKPVRASWAAALEQFGIQPDDKNPSSKRVKKAEAWFAKAQSNYLADSVIYEKANANYQQKLAQYDQAMKRYEDARIAWRQEAKRRIGMMVEHERQMYFYLYAVALRGAIKSTAKDINANYRNLTGVARSRAGLMTKRYFSGYDLTQDGRLIPSEYYRAFGLDFVKSDLFKVLERQVLTETARQDTIYKKIDALIQKTGLMAISDSLKDEIRKKELERAQSGQQKQQVLNAYVTDIDQLGWVNVDKFAKMQGERAPLAVKETDDASVYVACLEINSILPLYRSGDTFSIDLLPKGMRITVVAVKIKDGMPQLAIQNLVIGETTTPSLAYKSCTLSSLREEMKKLNG